MKNLFIVIALASAFATAARAQTNVAYRITVDGTNTSWSYDAAGSAKDQARIAGIKFAYAVYVAAQGTNTVLAIGPWLKQQHVVLIDNYASQKQSSDNASTAAKLLTLLTSEADLLSTSDLTALQTIAAKAQ